MRSRRFRPWLLPPGAPHRFPDPRDADGEGLLAIGGDLDPARLYAAYRAGIFPWFDAETPPLWWSPDPRAVLVPEHLHVPDRLRRTLRAGGFELRFDTAFRDVMLACDERRPDGSWIVPEMVDAYCALHDLGRARSFEVWRGEELVGGLYGVHIGGVFAAESMFHRATDMSKVALVTAVEALHRAGVELIDVQFETPHLARFGCLVLSRDDYLERLAGLRDAPVELDGLRLGS